jgi:hypothetical protein
VQAQLVALHRPVQRALRLEAGDGLGAHDGVEEFAPVPAPLLGPVHGGVGVAQEALGRVGAAVGHGDADAGPEEDQPSSGGGETHAADGESGSGARRAP